MEEKNVMTGADDGVCRYNDGVSCAAQGLCSACGWNPKVFRARRKELRAMEAQGETPHVSVQKRHTCEL